MRKFARTYWKVIIAILLAIVLATLTLETDSAGPSPDLSARLRAHTQAIASAEHDKAARHIESTLREHGYVVRRHQYEAGGRRVRNIEVSVSNTAPGVRPERIFIVGARHDPAHAGPDEHGSGSAAVLELARLLKDMRPSRGTEVKFVFLLKEEARAPARAPAGAPLPWTERHTPDSGDFIAFMGTLESSAVVRQALAAFKADADSLAQGLATPSHAMGVTLSDHASGQGKGSPALMITDTAFLHYPYHRTAQASAQDRARPRPQERDYTGMARVLEGLARTIESLAGTTRT